MSNVAVVDLVRARRPGPPRRLSFSADVRWLNHRVFRFPAKFHPPVANALVQMFSSEGDLVLDPFCGSGTLLVESLASGRDALGYDLDPLSVFVTAAKTRSYDMPALDSAVEKCVGWLARQSKDDLARDGDFSADITDIQFARRRNRLSEPLPQIPNLLHWFRRRVALQLASIKRYIEEHSRDDDVRAFMRLCFAAIIRNASNADPVPVSGLEVTAHMRRLEADGRAVNPFELLIRTLRRNLEQVREFEATRSSRSATARVFCRDAGAPWLENIPKADVCITSPPYLSAVDYYRRHQLEMFWLGLVDSQTERLGLLPRYIGRSSPSRVSIASAERETPSGIERRWVKELKDESPHVARAIADYATKMEVALNNQAKALKRHAKLVLVVGDSYATGKPFPTSALLEELASKSFFRVEKYWYPIQNRYMSYSRHNGASISRESVLVLQRV